MIAKIKNGIKVRSIAYKNKLYAKLYGLNSKKYWDYRFKNNWQNLNGRLQSMMFAAGFTSLDYKFENINSILDFGCGLADSIPVLKSKFNKSELFFYDFSESAMEIASKYYGKYASSYNLEQNKSFDLVYCSNVIEHITDKDINVFLDSIFKATKKYVVIQAPYNETWENGEPLTENTPRSEHVRTLNKDIINLFNEIDPNIQWEMITKMVPYAWDLTEQVFYIGKK
jgi:SAM-dependent methyltransferase